MMNPSISIIGGGIAGLTAAIALQKIGFEPMVFEAAPHMAPLGAGLVLASNAMKGLNKLGIDHEITAQGKLLTSFIISDEKGKTITKNESKDINGKYGLDNFAIHRADLHEVLLSKIKPTNIHIGKRAVTANQTGRGVKVIFEDGSVHDTDFLIVADGIHSAIRRSLLPYSVPRYAGYTCWRAVIENKDFHSDNAHEIWGTKGRFGYVPLVRDRLYWFACVNAPKNSESMKRYTINDLQKRFGGFHKPIPEILSATKNENLIWNDILDIKPIHQYAFRRIVVIGDAAHATTPNLGQGACQAIEDAVILASEMARSSNCEEAFRSFEKRRMKRTHFITNTSKLLGSMAQIDKPLLAMLRNSIFRNLPSGFNKKHIKTLYTVDLS